MLEALISSRIRRVLVEYLLAHPEHPVYLRGLAKELGLSISPLRRELKRLEQAGLLKAHEEGNIRFYAVDQSSPLFAQLQHAPQLAQVPAPHTAQPSDSRLQTQERAEPDDEQSPRRFAWRWPAILNTVSLTAIALAVLGVAAYLVVTNQQLLSVARHSLSAPQTHVTVVEPQSDMASEMRSSRLRLLPGALGGFSTGGSQDTY